VFGATVVDVDGCSVHA